MLRNVSNAEVITILRKIVHGMKHAINVQEIIKNDGMYRNKEKMC